MVVTTTSLAQNSFNCCEIKSNVDNIDDVLGKPFDTIADASPSLMTVSTGNIESPLIVSATTLPIPSIGFVDVQSIGHFTLDATVSMENVEFPQKTRQLLTSTTFTNLFDRFSGDS